MADLRIDRAGVFSTPLEIEHAEQNLGIAEELTSLPEWRGWDRIENSALAETPLISSPELNIDLSPVLEQLRSDAEYANLIDVDEKRLLLDVMNNVATKIDQLADSTGSQRLADFRETLIDLLDMYQTAYYQQLGTIKG